MKKIHCVHLFNDYSGSPLVFSTVIEGLVERKFQCEVYTSGGQEGFLSGMKVNYNHFYYKWLPNKILRLFMFLLSQAHLFFMLIKRRKDIDIIYINTILPFGAALAGKAIGKPVVYHLHEVSVKPLALKKMLRWFAQKTASQTIFVSHYLQEEEALPGVPAKVIPNALSDKFKAEALRTSITTEIRNPFRVLMLCSLKEYKGVFEFLNLAEQLPNREFSLVLNANQEEINAFFKGKNLPANLYLFPRQSNVHPFYQKAHLVLNLSHPEQWIETFGMTLLEAMYYGIPCIAPPVGGPAEIVQHDREGYLIDQRNQGFLVDAIEMLAMNNALYQRFSNAAIHTANGYSSEALITQVVQVLNDSDIACKAEVLI